MAVQDPHAPQPGRPLPSGRHRRQPRCPSDLDVTLAAAISRRRTDRRLYSPWSVSHGDIALMGARAARMGVTMRHVEPTPEWQAILAQAVHEHLNDSDYLAELAMWSGRHACADGVPA